MTATTLRQAIDAFKQAQRELEWDRHNRERAITLRRTRQQLEAVAASVLRRLPFRVYPVTQQRHFAVKENVELREGMRRPGQTLCGAPSGRPPYGHPAPCPACLLTAERYLLHGPPPLELDLGS